MLRADCTYTATIYRDGPEADWQTAPYDYLIETRTLRSSDTLRIPMASGGGFAIRLTPDK
jgi:alpha-glucosidase